MSILLVYFVDPDYGEKLVVLDSDGFVRHASVSPNGYSIELESKATNNQVSAYSKIVVNKFDQTMHAILQPSRIDVFSTNSISPIASVAAESNEWESISFLSSRTFLVTTNSGSSFIYYLGIQSDLNYCIPKKVPKESIVLVAQSDFVIFTKSLSVGNVSNQMYILLI
jgi:hypothetical protein